MRAWLSAICVLALSFGASQAQTAGVPLAAHRVVYDLTLAKGGSGAKGVDNARGRIAFDFLGHSRADARVKVCALRLRTLGRVTIERGGPPIEHAFVRGDAESRRRRDDWFEHRGGRRETVLEEQSFRKTKHQFDALPDVERGRNDVPQLRPRAAQIDVGGGLPEPFEKDSPEHHARAVRHRRDGQRGPHSSLGSVVLAGVEETPGFSQSVLRAERHLRHEHHEHGSHTSSDETHAQDGSTAVSSH